LQRHFPVARFRFVPRGDHSPTATSSPSLRPGRPERFPDKFSVSPVITIIQGLFLYSRSLSVSQHNHPMSSSFFSSLFSSTILSSFRLYSLSLSLSLSSGWAGASTLPAPAVTAVSFSVSEEVDPSRRSNP
jgi:hypothetical protein